jgi:hypothetical protein
VPSAPPVSPATVAAQIAHAVPTAQPGRHSQVPSGPHPARHARPAQEPRVIAQEQRIAEPRGETAAPPAAGREAPVPSAPPAAEARAAEAPAPEAPAPEAPAAAEAANEQAARQGRKSARGKRASVPSWDEIMFGNSRQRDLSVTARIAGQQRY